MKHRSAILLASILLLAAMPAFATTQATNTNTISPTLKVSVTVQSAIQLTLSTGGGCTINTGGGGDFSMSFGNVDALGINAPSCGSQFAPTTPGVSNAFYYTPYNITPIFTSQAVSTNTLNAYVSTNFAKANLTVVQSNSAPATSAALTAMSTSSASPTSVGTNLASATAVTRYLGVSIAPTNAAGLTGADSAIITYTLTVQ